MAAFKSWLFGNEPDDGVTASSESADPQLMEKKETIKLRESPTSTPTPRKRARFNYVAGDEEDEICGQVGSTPKSAKRTRATTERQHKGKYIKPDTPPSSSSTLHRRKEVTPRRRAEKTETTVMTPQSLDPAEGERTVRESIEKDARADLGNIRASLDYETPKGPSLVKHEHGSSEAPNDQATPASDDVGGYHLSFTGDQKSASELSKFQITGYGNFADDLDRYSGNSSSSSEDSESEGGSAKPLRIEQKLLNIILEARDEFTLMPSTWAMHFRGYPVPPSIFYTKVKDVSSRPRIYARTDKLEYNGTRIFLKIADIHSRIRDHRYSAVRDYQDRSKPKSERRSSRAAHGRDIVKKLKPVLEEAIEWSRQDGDLVKFGDTLPPNMQIIDVKNADSKRGTKAEIRSKMLELAQRWQNRMTGLEDKVKNGELEKLPEPPVIYALVIIEHQVLLAHMDASDTESKHHIRARLIMTAKNYQVWNALAIMVTVCWARDKLIITSKEMKLEAVKTDTDSDPDA